MRTEIFQDTMYNLMYIDIYMHVCIYLGPKDEQCRGIQATEQDYKIIACMSSFVSGKFLCSRVCHNLVSSFQPRSGVGAASGGGSHGWEAL